MRTRHNFAVMMTARLLSLLHFPSSGDNSVVVISTAVQWCQPCSTNDDETPVTMARVQQRWQGFRDIGRHMLVSLLLFLNEIQFISFLCFPLLAFGLNGLILVVFWFN